MDKQRLALLGGFLICLTMIVTALIFQYVMDLEPCPLCIVQRVIVMGIGAVLLVAALHNPGQLGRRIYGGLTLLVALIGAGVSSRHVWLQNLPPDKVPACGPGLEFWMEVHPPLKVMELLFKGSGECAEVVWSFLGLSIPGWTLVSFIAFSLFGLGLIFTRYFPRSRPQS